MKAGNFFEVDETSSSAFGPVMYRYNQIKKESTEGSSTDYPVYLSISKESVFFFLQYWESEKEKNYQHAKLIELPFSADIDYLKQILAKIYHKNSIIDSDEFKSEENGENKTNLSYWDVLPEKVTHETGNSGRIISHKKLLLDFLFDIKHSQVFSKDRNFPRLRAFLQENGLMSSLIAKAEYYYWKKHFEILSSVQSKKQVDSSDKKNRIENAVGKADTDAKSDNAAIKYHSKTLYESVTKKYIHSSTKWLNHIRSENADILFYKSQWFNDDLEDEYKNVFPKKTSHLLKKAFKVLEDSTEKIEFYKIKKNLRKESSIWFLRRYDLLTAFRCKKFHVQNFLPRLLMAITSVWFIIFTSQDLWRIGVNLELDFITLIGILTIITVVTLTFFYNEIRRLSSRANGRTIFLRSIAVYSYGLAYSLIIGFIIVTFLVDPMLLKTDILQKTFTKHLSNTNLVDPKHDVLLLYSDMMRQDPTSDRFIKPIEKSMLQINWSDSQAIADSKRFFILEFDTTKFKSTHSPPEGHHILPNLNKMGLSMSEEIACTFQVFHYLNRKYGGVNVEEVLAELKERLSMPNGIDDGLLYKNLEYLNLNIFYFYRNIFWGMIILYSFIALFAGLFFQLFFDDKPVTEPI